jgi:hypothetical protein
MNVQFLGFMLGNAGSGFLERVPALADPLVSYGPFQFTYHVIGKDAMGDTLVCR